MSVQVVDADLAHVSDVRMVQKVMFKRQAEADRQARFFDVRNRLIGQDTQALDAQVAAKKAAAAAEKEEDLDYANKANVYDQFAMMAEAAKERDRKAMAAECKGFSQQFLRQEYRREYHLSDPEALQRERNPDRDNAGPASMLKFEGERVALDKATNKQLYGQMQKTWLLEQAEEKELRRQYEKEMDQAYEANLLAVNELRGAIEVSADIQVRERKMEEANANLQLAEQKRAQRAAQKMQTENWDRTHVATTLSSPMLQEASENAGYKGMGAAHKQAVFDENALQMLDKRRAQEAERISDFQFDMHRLQGSAVMSTIEVAKMEAEKEKRRLQNMENDIIAKAQREMRASMSRTYKNAVNEDYFKKFNTTSR